MSATELERLVAATLYEGYILYPYRPSSVKNQVRWTFGGVHPRSWSDASGGSDPWSTRTECLLRDEGGASVSVRVRFLQLVTRTVARLDPSAGVLDSDAMSRLQTVEELRVADETHRGWDEATERDIDCGTFHLGTLLAEEISVEAIYPEATETEQLAGEDGMVHGALIRKREPLSATVTLGAERVGADLARVRVTVFNTTVFDPSGEQARQRALRRSLVSTHAILVTQGGEWLSLADPPADAAGAAAGCRNTGLWPVLVGQPGSADTVLASPIILEDHPQVAPESSGDLFDATEIDEILSLRILTLTDDEKAEMRAADTRARALLDRTESLTGDDLMRMHGTLRSVRPVVGERR